jgi:hypothetical protein
MASCEVSLSSSDHLAGDLLRATITVRGHGDTVEWAAVQVHGHCWHDPRLVVSVAPSPHLEFASNGTPKPQMQSRRSSSGSSLVVEKKTAMPDMSTWIEGTTCLFATKPHCLAAELILQGEHAFTFQVSLPPVLPPTFKGISTRYAYLLTVSVKLRSEESARFAHIPFYVAGTPGSHGDAARTGLPSSTFKEYLNAGRTPLTNNGHSARSKRAAEYSDDEEELVMIQSAARESGLNGDSDYINRFPLRYETWDPSISSAPLESSGRLWFLERDEPEEEATEDDSLLSPRAAAALHHHTNQDTVFSDGVSVRALNVQTGKGRLARCFVHPSVVHPGDAINIRLDFAQAAEKCSKVRIIIEVEERTSGPPPLVAVLEPLLRQRPGAGPWIKQLSSKSLDVFNTSSCAFSISTYGAPPDFSTDLIVVHTYLRIEFTTESMVCNLRVPLNVRPPPRALRVVSLSSTRDSSRMASPTSPLPSPTGRSEEQTPQPTPRRKLLF